ncbi:MAG: NIPSNAP family protein [Bacteroidales bacterium]|nr:NIPSNAP family protein [Bacteroidales bacterium]
MKRRTFLSAGVALGMTPVMARTVFAESDTQPAAGVQYYEWIRYRLLPGNKQSLVADYYRDAAIPALNKAGIKTVGVFNIKHGPDAPTLNVIIPHPTLDSVVTLNDRLLDDKSFVQAGNRFLNAPMSDPAFFTMEKSILKAFTGLPEIQIPAQKKANQPRIFQVRTYESASLIASKKKIQMFNEGGEIAIFKRTGLQPVLFGETVAGTKMPGLVYILAFDDMNDLDRNWNVFRNDPEWGKLKDDPYYTDIQSFTNDWIWTPAPFSQI